MKKILLVLGAGVAAAAFAGPTLEEGFRNPPNEAKPQVWWHWMNGNVAKEGIVADLESMAAVGIGGAQIFDAGCAIPPGDVAFNTPEWYEMFACAAETAARLKLELCHANCSGWSSSGGPWITPEKGMKTVLAPSETEILKGPMRFVGKLPLPPLPATNRWTVIPPGAFRADIAYLAVPAVANLPGTTNHLSISSLRSKMFAVRTNPIRRDTRVARPGEAIARDRVVDVTRFVANDGTLSWDVPAGEWRILRLQYASTGQNNGPASEKGLGYEVDKLSAEAVREHLDAYVGRLVKALGPNAGAHPYGLNNILVDSYEVGCQNWTQGFENEFARLAGYPITPYLPVLAGYVVGSVEESERFLEDYRRVIADLFAENYAGALQRRCHELGLRFSLEPYGNGPFDNLQYGRRCDIPVAEFWSHGQHRNDDCGNSRLAAHVAHVWGRRLVATESFTGEPTTGGRWLTTPFSIKAQGDCAFAAGVNRIVYHRFVHQPWKDPYLPGLTMGRWGMHYERSNTWWYEQGEWLKYQARCQWMLMEGRFAADILYYYGEKAPNEAGVYYGLDPLTPPKGYDYDQCDREALLALTVKDGRVVAPSGVSYAALVLPKAESMSLEVADKLAALLDAGAMIVAPDGKPTRVPGLKGYPEADAELARRIDALWTKGVIACDVGEALAARKIAVDCLCDTPNVLNSWIHRRDDAGRDWYFVACRNPSAMDVKFSFPETGRIAELWNPETGAIERADEAEVDWRGRRVVTLRNLPPDGSMFVVFREKSAAEALPVRTRFRTVATVSVDAPWTLDFPSGWGAPEKVELPTLKSWTDFADEDVRYFSGSAIYRTALRGIPALPKGGRYLLDLGDVRYFAEVTVNGRTYPSLWRPPFVLDVTDAVKGGEAELAVKVTNLWPNRLIGDAHKPEDCRWQQNEAFNNAQETGIAELPDWVRRGEKSPTGRYTFTTWRHWTKEDEPLDSGLLGPVRLKVQVGK